MHFTRNKTLLTTGILLALSLTTAFAGPPQKAKTPKKSTAPTSISCAVVPGDKVDIKKATADKRFADYKGRRYFFCCEGCPAKFKKDPAKYAKASSVPSPKATKKG